MLMKLGFLQPLLESRWVYFCLFLDLFLKRIALLYCKCMYITDIVAFCLGKVRTAV